MEAILSKLDDGQTQWASKTNLGVKGKATVAAFLRLVELGVLVPIGGPARAPYFAINRGAATARIERVEKAPKAQKAPKVPKPDESLAARAEILAALNATRSAWIAKKKLADGSKLSKAAYAQLVQDGTIIELGKLDKVDVVTAGRGQPAPDVRRALAIEVIVARGMPDALTAMPIAPKDPFWKGAMPTKVQESFQIALKTLLGSGRAVKLEGAGMKLFVLASSIHAASAELTRATVTRDVADAPEPGVGRLQPHASVAQALDTERVREAYRQLSHRQRAVHVTVADLWRDSGAALPALKSWLLAECQAHRADPALGEPSLATPEQLDAALVIDGRPHLYIQLENP